MTLDEVLASLFPAGCAVQRKPYGTFHGTGHRGTDGDIALIGIADGTQLGVEAALSLAAYVLSVVEQGGGIPIVLLVDTASQSVTRRDELLGLHEYLAHLSKALARAA